jgi:murein DD-endopeptidase MepM/ murein hydrolase activator NlpD
MDEPASRCVGMRKLPPLLLSLLAVLTFSFASCADLDSIRKHGYNRSGSSAKRYKKSSRYHVVRKGENLYRIAKRYKVSVGSLAKVNRISTKTPIEIGQRLYIPSSSKYKKSKRGRKKPKQKTTSRRSKPVGSIALAWPLKKYTITSKYGIRGGRKHDGIDLAAPKGTAIHASAGGRVIFSGDGPTGYGLIVIVKHEKGFITVYGHNNKNLVRKGEWVTKGQSIATVGKSGRATGYHCHFEVRANRKPVNPLSYLHSR